MTDELQELTPEPTVQKPAAEPVAIPATPKSSNRNIWLVAVIIIALVCLCSITCVGLIGLGGFGIYSEKAPIEKVLDSFMKNMAAKDVKSAYALFSARSQRHVSISDLQKMDQGNNYVLFEGYESSTVQNLNISAAANTNPDLPQGTVATATGSISYTGGFSGRFTAVLEKVDGHWELFSVDITVPPDKFQP